VPLNTTMLGEQTPPFVHEVDARWLMAYAAGINDLNPRYMDTAHFEVLGHPLFPVCLEWPAILGSRELRGFETVTAAESARGVHAAHDLHIYQPIVAGECYSTQATIIGLLAIKPGAAHTLRLDTFNRAGELVCQTWQLSISRDVAVVGEAVAGETVPALPDSSSGTPLNLRYDLPVQAGAANIYTECARIWNPIHSDKAFALAAGLPDIILHGTATLALAVSKLVDEHLGADPTRVVRIGGRFTGMVLMPAVLCLQVQWQSDDYLGFVITDGQGVEVFSQGFVGFR
jgi:acyl dehydratase